LEVFNLHPFPPYHNNLFRGTMHAILATPPSSVSYAEVDAMGRSLTALSFSLLLTTSCAVLANAGLPKTAVADRSHTQRQKIVQKKVKSTERSATAEAPSVEAEVNQPAVPPPSNVVKEQPAVILVPDGSEADDDDIPAGALYTDSDEVG
jgi:hypothetical protein